ncbi:MAG: UbiA family prenyltransferase [Candidatus Thermoplasmatota archaeon]|nr:UbiA family prenyltransferase [Candidatus Thermoplasmatota archaeon]
MNHANSTAVTMQQKLFAHLETMRPYTLLWCGLVSLVGAALRYGGIPPIRIAVLVFFIPILGWIAGLYLADYYDKALDAIQKPHRPIPSGRISSREALSVGASFAILGLGLSLFLPLTNILLIFIAGTLVLGYAKYTKAKGLLGNFNRGAMTVVTYLFGVFSIETPSPIPVSLWLLSLVFFFHDTNSNIIGAIRDVYGDQTGGYTTTPVKYGIRHTLLISVTLSIVYLLLTVGILFFFPLMLYPIYFLVLFSIGLLVLCVMYLVLFTSVNTLTQKQSLYAHELFVAERIIFSSAFIVGIASSHVFIVTFCIVSLIVTLFSQHLLRERYELT